jgi:hypothetical protein
MSSVALQVGQEIFHEQFGKGVVTGFLDKKIKAQFETEEFEKIVSYQFLQYEKPRTKTPVYITYRDPTAIGEFVEFLRRSDYTLHTVCRNIDQVDQVKSEYRKWSSGKKLPDSAILTSFDGSQWDREWFLIFRYSPDISYPFSILERGTGGNKRSPEPVAWHRCGRIESCYAAIAEEVIKAGLDAKY